MALMDMPTLEPLANALPNLLTPNGRFIATVMHPAFNSSGMSRGVQVIDDPTSGRVRNVCSVNVERYLDIPPTRGEAIIGQPKPQYYFHRPLSELLRPFLAKGFVLDGFEEPAFKECPDRKGLSWENYWQIPPVMGFRLKKGPGLL
ncbi:hypothetical protein BDD12DRAFT_848334 [Trichophaea hybrida]|nr:hypothetical protein BDD12DRAFT_848334 [Trichophaea hybrida]